MNPKRWTEEPERLREVIIKLTFEDKIEIVRLYQNEHQEFGSIAKKYCVYKTIIQDLIYKYKEHDIETLKHSVKNKTYSADYKLMIITEVYSNRSSSVFKITSRF